MTSSTTEKNILEDIDLLLIDEAHEISNVATDVFTLKNYLNDFQNSIAAFSKYKNTIKVLDEKITNILNFKKNMEIHLKPLLYQFHGK